MLIGTRTLKKRLLKKQEDELGKTTVVFITNIISETDEHMSNVKHSKTIAN